MISVTINETTISVPDKWPEVTVKQYCDLCSNINDLNAVRLLSILSGIAYETLLNFDCSIFETGILPAMNFVKNSFSKDPLPLPEKIIIGEKELVVPKDIAAETFGQKVMLQMKINEAQDAQKDLIELIPFTIATYLSPIYYGQKYDDKRAEMLIPLIQEMPITQAYPVAYFFLNRWAKLSKTKLASYN